MKLPLTGPERTPDPTDQASDDNRRGRGDRRRRPTPIMSRYMFRGRRRNIRRQGEEEIGYYVDRQTPFEYAAVLSLLILAVTDALATLHIISLGGREVNPLMKSALDVGDSYFLMVKLGISILGGVLILLHARFPGVKKALHGLIALYSGVVVYHAVLLVRASL